MYVNNYIDPIPACAGMTVWNRFNIIIQRIHQKDLQSSATKHINSPRNITV